MPSARVRSAATSPLRWGCGLRQNYLTNHYYDETTDIYQPVLRRLLPDGALDDSFAGDGTLELRLDLFMGTSSGADYVEDLAVEANGNIVAVGSTYQPYNGVDGYQQYVYRAQSNGQPDTSFGSQGARLVKFGTNEFGNYEAAYSVTVQQGTDNDRKIVTGGYYRQNADTPYLLSLVRHQVNGEVDSTFLASGKGTLDLPDNVEDFPGRFLLQPDDGILTHVASYQATQFVVARFTAAGVLDTGFHADGIAATVLGRALGIAQSGRRAIVVGSAQPAPDASQKARVARYRVR